MRKSLLLNHFIRSIALLLTTMPFVFGQSNTVRGKIIEMSDGTSLPGVNVLVKGTTIGTVTDSNGDYTIRADGGETLVFSFIGYTTREEHIDGRSTINISMSPDTRTLDEVVVVGYGTMKKADLTSAVAKVNNEQLEKRAVTRLDQALQGQLAGVRVQQNSGVPGSPPIIRIRGVGSITSGNVPLYVIDGIPIEDVNVIANLNFNDVESVEVLKDAASASIYGSRGSNGVILVTTKKGKGKVKLNYNMYTGIQSPEKLIDFLDGPEYAEYIVERRNNSWVRQGGSPSDPNEVRPANLRLDPLWVSNPSAVKGYDHQDWLFRNASMQNHQLSVSGGSDKMQYYISGGYMNQEGMVLNTGFERYSFRAKVDVDVNENIKFGINIAPSASVQRDANTEGKERNIHRILLAPSLVDIQSLRWDGNDNPPVPYGFYGWQVGNSVDQIISFNSPKRRAQVLSNLFTEISFLKNFKYRTSVGIVYGTGKENRFWNEAASRGNLSSEIWTNNGLNWLTENILSYSNNIGPHDFSAMLGYTTQKDHDEWTYLRGIGFPNELVETINYATDIDRWNEGMSEWSLLSYIGRMTYNYDSRYLMTASIRRDGSSRFGSDNRWGYFPSFSLGWRISEETFMSDINLVNDLKLRGSWGVTGNNQIGNYSSIARLDARNYALGADEVTTPGLSPSSKSVPELGWEKTAALDIGVDAGFFRNRIYLSADYYINKTSDLLFSMPIPTVTGFGSTIQNIGEVENRGYEIELLTRNLTGAFKWQTSFNYSNNHNEVKKLRDNDAPITSGSWTALVSRTEVGQPIGAFYMHVQEGIWNTDEEINANPSMNGDRPGGERLKDINGDAVVNGDDRQIVGSPIPVYSFGITNEFSFHNFDLSIFINGAGGNKIYNDVGRQLDNGSFSAALYGHWADRWRSPANPGNGKTPNADVATPANSTPSTRYLYDGDFFRLQNVTFGYTLPASLLDKVKVSSLRLYVSGENLYLNDKYPVGYNPEVSTGGESVLDSPGYDYGIYPLARKLLFGLAIGL